MLFDANDKSYFDSNNETLSWLISGDPVPIWSRLNRRNTEGNFRQLRKAKQHQFDIEVKDRLWSLWGELHPTSIDFAAETRGKQYLACNVLACCAATVYPLNVWNSQLLDAIVTSGDRYHLQSLAILKKKDSMLSLKELGRVCMLKNLKFKVFITPVAFGKLYCTPTNTRMNLAQTLMIFFSTYQVGILQCHNRSLAIGRDKDRKNGFFMYDCESNDQPLFPKGEGASYMLRTSHLQILLFCIVFTLKVPYFNVEFTLHKVKASKTNE